MTRSKWRLAIAWLISTVAGGLAVIAYSRAAFDEEIGIVESMVGAGVLSAVMLIVLHIVYR